MTIKNIKKIAQEIIEKTASIVAPNTVNLMDEKGIIIASSDEKRINTFHSGAFQAIKEKKEICIYPNEVDKFQGAKQGVNIPIVKENKVVAVIGIFGNPDEIKQTAYLLSISTSLFLDQDEFMKKEQRKSSLRNNLSEILFSKDNQSEISEILDALAISFKYPIRPIIFNFKETKPSYNSIYNTLIRNNYFSSNSDILLEYPNFYLMLKSNNSRTISKSNFNKFKETLNINKLILGNFVNEINELNQSLSISKALLSQPINNKILDCTNLDDISLLIFDIRSHDLLKPYLSNLITTLDNENSYWIYETIEEYINNNSKISEIAKALNIHKNTCIYRINKILSLCNLNNCNNFTISYFFRSIIYYKKNSK